MNNIMNKIISAEDVNNILNKHLENKVDIKNISLYVNSCLHKSFFVYDYSDSVSDSGCVLGGNLELMKSNEKLEFLGDRCLDLVAAEYLYDKYPNNDEGFLTKAKTRLVRKSQLAIFAEKIGLKEWLLISCHIERISGRDNPRLLEDFFESFIGALYKDMGILTCKEFLTIIFEKYADIQNSIDNNDNYKDILLRFFQKNKWQHPEYKTILETGNARNKKFYTCVLVKKDLVENNNTIKNADIYIKKNNQITDDDYYYIAMATGKTKKESQQHSSKECLKILNISFKF